ncbi:PRD domain-containing protein [Kineothrix sp. MB12-C1]|uniref:PRD domain-containing protein n=1 Tax=Kineothrix sp. MB12-C1 TaxID=3070215 RepID=UPI0027D28EE7|nr:PRD domain-containing protein [Kineothrix sp. MB12-C1]WMC92622.1 PRD domain-containing protein [Kineothrix sp. MB12-C1]
MKIDKIINNNIISSKDVDNSELIVMGCGLGFGKKVGQSVDETKIEKIFKLDNKDSLKRFKELLKKLPLEYIQVSDEIISYAKGALGKELNENVYLTLTDHIGFAIDRFKEGMIFGNALFEEIKMFYPNEYTVGCHALYLIEKKTGIRLLDEEAASIAIHIVNAEFNSAVGVTFMLTQMLREMMEIIEQEIPTCKTESYQPDKLAINFKYLVHRMLTEQPEQSKGDEVLYDFVRTHCKREYELIRKVNDFIKDKYDCFMTEEESIYLTLNVKRISDLV